MALHVLAQTLRFQQIAEETATLKHSLYANRLERPNWRRSKHSAFPPIVYERLLLAGLRLEHVDLRTGFQSATVPIHVARQATNLLAIRVQECTGHTIA